MIRLDWLINNWSLDDDQLCDCACQRYEAAKCSLNLSRRAEAWIIKAQRHRDDDVSARCLGLQWRKRGKAAPQPSSFCPVFSGFSCFLRQHFLWMSSVTGSEAEARRWVMSTSCCDASSRNWSPAGCDALAGSRWDHGRSPACWRRRGSSLRKTSWSFLKLRPSLRSFSSSALWSTEAHSQAIQLLPDEGLGVEAMSRSAALEKSHRQSNRLRLELVWWPRWGLMGRRSNKLHTSELRVWRLDGMNSTCH